MIVNGCCPIYRIPKGRELGSRVIDLAEQVYRNNDPRFTDFLDPRGVDIAGGILQGIQGLAYFSSGGYREAERRILAIYPDYCPAGDPGTTFAVPAGRRGFFL